MNQVMFNGACNVLKCLLSAGGLDFLGSEKCKELELCLFSVRWMGGGWGVAGRRNASCAAATFSRGQVLREEEVLVGSHCGRWAGVEHPATNL